MTGQTLLGLQMYGYIACTAGLIILQARNTLPEIVGLALFTDGHIGYYVGGGYAVEWRGFNYGCVKTVVKERTWKHWAKLPFINYGDTGTAQPAETVTYTLGSRLLKMGSAGGDVKTLQELLNQLGASLTLDGDFGSKTETAVKAFQKKAGRNRTASTAIRPMLP